MIPFIQLESIVTFKDVMVHFLLKISELLTKLHRRIDERKEFHFPAL